MIDVAYNLSVILNLIIKFLIRIHLNPINILYMNAFVYILSKIVKIGIAVIKQ